MKDGEENPEKNKLKKKKITWKAAIAQAHYLGSLHTKQARAKSRMTNASYLIIPCFCKAKDLLNSVVPDVMDNLNISYVSINQIDKRNQKFLYDPYNSAINFDCNRYI